MNKPLENKPRLLDQVRDKLRLKHYSYRTEQSYIAWIKRFIFFHNKQHPDTMGEREIETFLTFSQLNAMWLPQPRIRHYVRFCFYTMKCWAVNWHG
jgi:hypothetical protein